MDVELSILAVLTLVAVVAGFVDSIAGGGGLLALPALLLAGLDPVAALATNKLQGTFGTASATFAFWKNGKLDIAAHVPAVVTVFVGAALGVLAIAYAPTQLLSAVMPIVLILIAVYFAFSPRLSERSSHPRFVPKAFIFGFAPVIGFYDGIFGPGTGSFFMLALVSLFGAGLTDATARTKLFNFTSNIASLLIFAYGGKIVWTIGLCMGGGQFVGAQLGTRLAIHNGAKIIRPLLITVCCAMAMRLLFDPANPLRAALQ
jgi:uncharacterized protein